MDNDTKFTELIKNFFDRESAFKRIPFYLFTICVLLVVLILKLNDTNNYLGVISNSVKDFETRSNDFYEFSTEADKSLEEYVPLMEILTENTTEETTVKSSSEKVTTTTTKPSVNNTETTTQANSNSQNTTTTYVININSNKIHYADCTFADRTKEENKKTVTLTDKELQAYLNDGYTFCKTCGGD